MTDKTAKHLVETLGEISILVFLVTAFAVAIYIAICISIYKVGLITICALVIIVGCKLTLKRINQTKDDNEIHIRRKESARPVHRPG